MPAVFELDRELLSTKKKAESPRMKQGEDSVDSSAFASHSAVVAPAELEIEVAYLLDSFRARFGDQIALTRTPNGSLEVQGVVANEESRKQILQALASVINHPALKVQISTTAEVLERQKRQLSDRVIVQEFAGSENRIPVYPELRSYFSRHVANQGQGKTVGQASEDNHVDEAVRAFAARVVSRSRRALSHAIELKQLSERFSATQLDALTPGARIKLLTMIGSHAEALRRETSQLRGDLQPVFFATESESANSEPGEISIDAGLAPAIERLYKSVLANDVQIRSAFAASSDGPEPSAMKAPRFRLSLATAERLADRIRQAVAKG